MNDVARVPPYSEEAEKAVLGAVMQDTRIVDACVEQQLVEESFYIPANRIVYAAMLELTRRGRPIDVLMVAEELAGKNELERIGGEGMLHRLIDDTPTVAHAGYYIGIVREKYMLRRIIDAARNAESECYEAEESAEALLGRVEQRFFDITKDERSSIVAWPEMLEGAMADIANMREGGDGLLKTGYKDLDKQLGGMRPGNMIVLAARPSMGKTSLAMNIAENVAGSQKPVGIFSLEMSRDDLALRMLCSRARVSMQDVRLGYVTASSDKFRKLEQARQQLEDAQIHLDDSAGLDVAELRARARRMKRKHKIELVIVDYLQLLGSRDNARQGRQFEIAAVSGSLKAMAKELSVPVLVLSQLSRAPEAREDGKPRLSHLRDSGSIEQDADVVLLLRRPCKYAEDNMEDRRLAIVDLAKNRSGPTRDDIELSFEEEYTRFEDRAAGRAIENIGAAVYEEVEM